jgi:hypothetical protein
LEEDANCAIGLVGLDCLLPKKFSFHTNTS